MKAVVLDGYTLNPGDLTWVELQKIVDLKIYDRTDNCDILKRIGDAEIVITNKVQITKRILDKAPNIKYVGVLATGYNVVDIEAAKAMNIPVTNVPQYSTTSVAQLVFALILSVCHHVESHSESVLRGDWTNSKDYCYWNYPLIELSGKTLGIIGFGSIGQSVSKIAQSFGMNLLVYTKTVRKEYENEFLKFVSLEDLYKNADIITLHTPLTHDTKQMINKQSINNMKNGVIIINTSRGGLIVEKDLFEALESEKVFAAAVDVVSEEPIKENNPLLKAKNIFITPHIAWAPKESRMRLMDIAVMNIKGFLNHELINVVNGVK